MCRWGYRSEKIGVHQFERPVGSVGSRLGMALLPAFSKRAHVALRHVVTVVDAVVSGVAQNPQTLGVNVSHSSVSNVSRYPYR